MKRIRTVAGPAILMVLGLVLGTVSVARAQDAAAGAQQKYTMPEYNAEQACANENNPTAKIKCLDDFVGKYPNSYLLKYAYPMYYQAYYQGKNWAKVIENVD